MHKINTVGPKTLHILSPFMKYKGYVGSAIFDHETGILHGRVANVEDVITFQGTSVAGTRQAFHDSVEDYLEFCAERGETPEKPIERAN